MGTERTRRPVLPVARADLGIAHRMQRIMDAAAGAALLADHQQAHVGIGVVQEGVCGAGALGKADPVAWLEIVDLAIDPDLRPPFQDIDELLEIALGMRPEVRRPGGSRSW